MHRYSSRRHWLSVAGATAVGLGSSRDLRAAEKSEDDEKEVLAVEDLMREHGVLRRALLVYAEFATRLDTAGRDIPLDLLGRTATLFRDFGERYHEKSLEEAHVFVPLIKAGGRTAELARTLQAQHERGRQITEYLLACAKQRDLPSARRVPLSRTLTSFVRMYEHHAALEDTVIFPAWKAALSSRQYAELSEEFEDLEHRMFGKDGFEAALQEIGTIEGSLGLADLDSLTAPPPPRSS